MNYRLPDTCMPVDRSLQSLDTSMLCFYMFLFWLTDPNFVKGILELYSKYWWLEHTMAWSLRRVIAVEVKLHINNIDWNISFLSWWRPNATKSIKEGHMNWQNWTEGGMNCWTAEKGFLQNLNWYFGFQKLLF